MNTSSAPGEQMLSFRTLAQHSLNGPRLGKLLSGSLELSTPTYIAPTSRGAIPHLSADNLRDHTRIRGAYFALEDFIERGIPSAPVLSRGGSLREFTSTPKTTLLFLGARRCPPVTTAATNTDHSVAILTSTGFTTLAVNDYVSAAASLRPDVAVSVPDVPSQLPGKSRRPKMAFRTEKWLEALLDRVGEGGGAESMAVFAAVPPLPVTEQALYLQLLQDRQSELAGLALYDSSVAVELPEELKGLPRLALDDPDGPFKVLTATSQGVDVFNLGFLVEATDAGIAFDFEFPGRKGGGVGLRPMGLDLWDAEFGTDLGPLVEGCGCYSCKKHHKAYVQHLLNAKEMSAWVLLQIHNSHVMDLFFEAIRESIQRGTFEEDVQTFERIYESKLPAKTGRGPRIRGYQYKTAPGPRKNKKAFERFAGDQRETLEETSTPPDVDAAELEESGFAERVNAEE